MSEPFNQLLLAPSEDRLVAALELASRRSGLDRRGADHWRPLLDEVADNADGRSQMEHSSPDREGSRYVVVAWWTDHQGRKHVRVAGGDTDDKTAHRHFSRLDIDARPPLWHIAPGWVYRVKRGEQPVWLVCCGCGETGSPAELAWMGDCCGPCHDRREEGEVIADAAPSITYGLGRSVYSLAVAPSGLQLACSVDDRQVRLIDLAAQSQETLFAPYDGTGYEQIHHLVFSPDGDFLAAGDKRGMAVRAWRMRSREVFVLGLEEGEGVTGPVFSPDSRYLAAWTDAGAMMVWYRQADDWKEFFKRPGVTALAFSPDGRTLALGGPQGKVGLLSTSTGAEQGQISTGAEEDVLWLEHLPGGQQLLMLTGSTAPDQSGQQWQLRLWDLAGKREERASPLWPPYSVALAPDGRHFAYLYRDQRHSPAAVYFWDVQAWKPAGWLESDSEAYLTALTFTADGRSLVTGTDLGVIRLYPWQLLFGSGRKE